MMNTDVPLITPTYADVSTVRGALRVAQINLPGIPRGAVIVLYGPDGLEDHSVQLMNGLAEHGYESLLANMATLGPEPLDDESALEALRSLVSHLGEQGWSEEQIGVVGYHFGGRVALRAAEGLRLGAAVSVSPECVSRANDTRPALVETARPVDTPWLGLFGEDEDAPNEAVQRLAERLTNRSPAYTEVVTYSGVSRGFFQESTNALEHAAMFDSWQRTVEWLNRRVVPRKTPYAEIWSAKKAMSD